MTRAKNEINFLMCDMCRKKKKSKMESGIFIRSFLRDKTCFGIVVSNCVQVHQETSEKSPKKI